MRLGISTWVYAKYRIEDSLRRLAGMGFKVLELWADQVQLDPRVFPEDSLDDLKKLSEDLGLTFQSLHAPFSGLDVASPYDAKRDNSIQWVLRAFEYASRLGCAFVVVHPGSAESMVMVEGKEKGRGEEGILEAKERLSKALEYLGREAWRLNIKVLLENMTQRNGRRYGSRISDLVEVIDALGKEEFGICLDPGHTVISRLDVYDELRMASELLLSIHANDNDGLKDLHLLPMEREASINWLRFLKVLRSIGYKGAFMLEVYGGDNPDRIAEGARALCERLPGLEL
ncbi:sugar phosphate isomerase/epimerase [Candidatus Bathyarchaeota archaeon]|nr:sugar phosphate isomerase/epimerase [Candidatus Bathyarchaeota archaeon]